MITDRLIAESPSQSFTDRYLTVFIILGLLLASIYSNAPHGQWQMDDKPNIVDNTRIHIDNLMPSTLYQTFFAYPGSQIKLYRPIPMLTFALNWYLGEKNPFGYHLINIFIHLLTAFVLFVTIRSFFATPVLKGKYPEYAAFSISLLSTILWAINPIQTQAVTYIVQRMAIMASLFYLLGLFFYIQARLIQIPLKRKLFFIGCAIAFICALGSKENAAVFPITIILVEFAFFQNSQVQKETTVFIKIIWITVVLSFISLVLVYTKGNPFFFLDGYSYRTYNWIERLLAQPRVLVLYLSLIFYPLPQRLSIDHGIRLSKSLLDPWTTLPAIFLVLLIVLIGIFQIRKRPLLCFPICFFFLNHLIESSVIPLEIIFEHRNYLPSTFLFLPLSAGFFYLFNYYRKKNPFIYYFLFIGLTAVIFTLGIGTYVRNMAWSSKKSLWEDAATKAPGNTRPLVNLAIELGWKETATQKDIETALALLNQSIPLYKPNKFHHAEIFSNIGGIYFRIQDYPKAIGFYEKALLLDPFSIITRYNLVQSLILMQRWNEASEHLDFIIEKGSGKFNYFNLKGFVLLWQNRTDEAIHYLREALSRAPNDASVLLNIGVALSKLGNYKNAKWFLRRSIQASPKDIFPYFGLIENAVKAKEFDEAEQFAQELLSIQNINVILNSLEQLPQNFKCAPLLKNLIDPVIKEAIFKSIILLKKHDR